MNETTDKELSLSMQSVWIMSAKIISFALSFLLPLLTVRYLTQNEYGTYRQIFLVVSNAVSILPLGFSMSAYYYLSRESEKRASAIFNILLFNFVMGGLACATLFVYPQLMGIIFQNDELTYLAPKFGVVIWLWIISFFLETVTLANQETKLATVFIIFAQLTKTIFMIGALVLFTTVESLIYAAMAQSVVQICVLLVYLNQRFPQFWKRFNFSFFREQISYAIPFGLAGLLFHAQSDIHYFFVGHQYNEAVFAIYSIGCFQLPLIAMLYESFGSVMIPRMSQLQAEGKKREMITTIAAAMQKLAFVYFPVFVFLMIVADVFVTTLFTEKFSASISIFRVNLFFVPIYCIILDPIGRAFKEIGTFLLKVRILLFPVLATALWFGIRNLQLSGVIGIVVIIVYIETAISLTKIISILEVKREDIGLLDKVGRTAAAALSAGIVLFVFYWFARDFLLKMCAGFSLYVMSFIHFEKVASFLGGSLFLAICLLVFLTVYLFSAVSLDVIEDEHREKLTKFLQRLTLRNRKWLVWGIK